MPARPLRPCRHPGCSELVVGGYCAKHKTLPERGAESRSWHGWYSLRVWTRQLRPAQLLREPFCRECAARGIRTLATDVDHVTPHRGDWAVFIDPDDLQSLCRAHHSAKTIAEMREKDQKKPGASRRKG